jgi:hypothetical protein
LITQKNQGSKDLDFFIVYAILAADLAEWLLRRASRLRALPPTYGRVFTVSTLSATARGHLVSALLTFGNKNLRVVDVLSNRVQDLHLSTSEVQDRHPNTRQAMDTLNKDEQTLRAFDRAVHRLLGDKVALLEQPIRVTSFKIKPATLVSVEPQPAA